jgi:hypothetical protein
MANITNKKTSELSMENVLRHIHNQQDATIGVNGFITLKQGHRITRVDIDSLTEDYSFFDGTTLLYTIRIVYTNITQDKIASVERTV